MKSRLSGILILIVVVGLTWLIYQISYSNIFPVKSTAYPETKANDMRTLNMPTLSTNTNGSLTPKVADEPSLPSNQVPKSPPDAPAEPTTAPAVPDDQHTEKPAETAAAASNEPEQPVIVQDVNIDAH